MAGAKEGLRRHDWRYKRNGNRKKCGGEKIKDRNCSAGFRHSREADIYIYIYIYIYIERERERERETYRQNLGSEKPA